MLAEGFSDKDGGGVSAPDWDRGGHQKWPGGWGFGCTKCVKGDGSTGNPKRSTEVG